jgi:acyl dehydratase
MKKFYEDIAIGDTLTTNEEEMTEAEIVRFASQFDPQAFHTDPAAAKNLFFGGLVASGWHTAALTMRLMVRALASDEGLIGQGVESLRWPRPTRAGDRLRVEIRVEDKREKRGRADYGTVTLRCITRNQDGKIAQEMVAHTLVRRQPPQA